MPPNADQSSPDKARISKLQARINEALPERTDEHPKVYFSPYAAHLGPDLLRQLRLAASRGGIEGLEAAMDAYDQLSQSSDARPENLRHALHLFLQERDELDELGLQLPSR